MHKDLFLEVIFLKTFLGSVYLAIKDKSLVEASLLFKGELD